MLDRANNFDTLRFWAAMAVLWSHAFPLTMGSAEREPLAILSGGQTDLATIALAIFFVISGYLVTQSFVRSSSVWRFVKARILRIMPGLLIVLLLLGLLMGPLVTTLPLSEYFSSKVLYRFLILNGSLLDYYSKLPGVFSDNPYPGAVDGPLWTLRIEAECYALVFALGILGLLNRYVTAALFLGGLLILVLDGPYSYVVEIPNPHINLGTMFLAGAVIYHWRPNLNGTVAVACLGVSTLALLFGGFWLALPTLFAYAVIYVALGPIRLPSMAKYGDLSYGIYIYAWPVKQLIVMYSVASTWYWVGSIATLIVIPMAFVSWHLVEKVALSFKDHMLPAERRLSRYLDRAVVAVRLMVFRLLPRGIARSLRESNSNPSPSLSPKTPTPGSLT